MLAALIWTVTCHSFRSPVWLGCMGSGFCNSSSRSRRWLKVPVTALNKKPCGSGLAMAMFKATQIEGNECNQDVDCRSDPYFYNFQTASRALSLVWSECRDTQRFEDIPTSCPSSHMVFKHETGLYRSRTGDKR